MLRKRPWGVAILLLWQPSHQEKVCWIWEAGGIDVLLSARRVAPNGKAYGLDMAGEMLTLAHKNQQEAGVVKMWSF